MAPHRLRALPVKPDLVDQQRRATELRGKLRTAGIERSKLDYWLDSLSTRGGGFALRNKRTKKALSSLGEVDGRLGLVAQEHVALHHEFDPLAAACEPGERLRCSSTHVVLHMHFGYYHALFSVVINRMEHTVREQTAVKKLKSDGSFLGRGEVVRRLRNVGLTHSDVALLLCFRNDQVGHIAPRAIEHLRLESTAAVVRKALSDGKRRPERPARGTKVTGKKRPARSAPASE